MLLNRSIPTFNTKKDKDGESDNINNKKFTHKEHHNIEKAQHANDFFMGMMQNL